ncbi:MAG: hypothetical protein ABIH92_01450 [Nanoarchaeota archaeon]
MKFKIARPELLHENLRRFSEYTEDADFQGAFSDGGGEEGGFGLLGCAYTTDPIAMRPPIKSISFQARSIEGFYSAAIAIATTGQRYLGGLSARFSRDFLPQDKKKLKHKDEIPGWVSVDPRGVGYITGERVDGNVPIFSIGRFSCHGLKDNGRVITLGDFGTELRSVKEKPEEFGRWMLTLQQVADVYVGSVYGLNRKRPRKTERDLTLFLNWIL